MPQQVIFSERAYTAILSETLSKITTETGGILLGHFNNNKWYIVESIDPGPKSVFSTVYFEYDETYVNHLANKINVLYNNPLKIMGLWHRHPGSMDVFSSTDNGTHEKYANINPFGVISMLVNIDPVFRLSIYYVSRNAGRLSVSRDKMPYSVGNKHIPAEFLGYKPSDFLQEKIRYNTLFGAENNSNTNNNSNSSNNKKNAKILPALIKRVFTSGVNPMDMQNLNVKAIPVNDKDIEKILEAFAVDLDFFEKNGITCNLSKSNDNILRLYGENDQGSSCVEVFTHKDIICIRNNQRTLSYKAGLFLKAFSKG